ncbi:MAG: flagellar type III secretion system protein FliR [Desulfobacterales bacterium]|nr:MAG: flagellar type III secretion system protein FliR [Desulfobacterales bacterium]
MLAFNISLSQLQMFFLVFLRVSAIVTTMPIFNSQSIPILVKAGLAFATSVLLFPILKLEPLPVFADLFSFVVGVTGEIMFGIIIGLCVNLIFAGLQMAGQLAGYQMGLAIVEVMDPASSEQVPILAQYHHLMALLLFVIINAHHWFVRALVESFRLVPPLDYHLSNTVMEQLIRLAGHTFIIAIKVGAPVIAALLLTSVAFGLVARTVPQMNVFLVAMPINIFIGLLFIGFSLPYLVALIKQLFSGLGRTLLFLLQAMAG